MFRGRRGGRMNIHEYQNISLHLTKWHTPCIIVYQNRRGSLRALTQPPPKQRIDIDTLLAAYRAGDVTPSEIVTEIYRRNAAYGDDALWIHLIDEDTALRRAREQSAASR